MLTPKPDFKNIESKWQRYWEEKGIYKFNPASKKKVYSIDTPPPYISGELHMGHGVSYTGFEFFARYKRMAGFNVFFPIGFDDNGHPTERYVEQKYGIKSSEMPREKFISLCQKEAKILEKTAREAFNAFGHSYDWDLFYSTISPIAIKTAQKSFVDLHKKNLVYRAEEPTLWCTDCQTALSQADVEDEKRETKLNTIYFELEGGKKIEIATTRPELLPACVGIFVHPKDKRHKTLIGKTAITPLFNHKVAIRADEKVDPEFGSGIVMVCTFGDNTDIEWWRKHKLETKIIISKDGKVKGVGGLSGKTLREAKNIVLEKLEADGLLKKQEPLTQNVGVCWRCKQPVEFIMAKQWAIRTLKFKKEFISQGRKIKWHPGYYIKRYEDWVNNLGWDWVISRQRHYGVPIPVWYCRRCGEPIVAYETQIPVDPVIDKPKGNCKCGSSDFRPEIDVFDTWMTSSMTPEIPARWADTGKTDFLPYDLRPQGYDIIRTWAFTTILKSYFHFRKIPWKSAAINGFVLDPQGKAMHKSTGNVINPMAMVEKYGADSFRYFASTVNFGEDAPFQEKELVRGQKLLIKLWNVARFVEMQGKCKEIKSKNIADRWILAGLGNVIKKYHNYFEKYDAISARRELEQFFWHELCDFYLEMIKYRLYGSDEKEKESAAATLNEVFYKVLQMFAVYLPHIAEEIYQELYGKEQSIHITQLPKAEKVDKKALELGKMAVTAIAEIRKYKADNGLSLGAELESYELNKKYEKLSDVIKGTMRVKELILN